MQRHWAPRKTGLLQGLSRKQGLSMWMCEFKLFLQTQFAGKNAKHNTTPLSLMSRAFHISDRGYLCCCFGSESQGQPLHLWASGSKRPRVVLNSPLWGGDTVVSGPDIKPTVWSLKRTIYACFSRSFMTPYQHPLKWRLPFENGFSTTLSHVSKLNRHPCAYA